jgi:hypothetical protein
MNYQCMFNVYSKFRPKTSIRKQNKQSVSIISEQPSYSHPNLIISVTPWTLICYTTYIEGNGIVCGLKTLSMNTLWFVSILLCRIFILQLVNLYFRGSNDRESTMILRGWNMLALDRYTEFQQLLDAIIKQWMNT